MGGIRDLVGGANATGLATGFKSAIIFDAQGDLPWPGGAPGLNLT